MQSILITGASGLLGANLVIEAQKRGHGIIAATHHSKLKGENVRCIAWSLEDMAGQDRLVQESCPEWVVHCAAWTDVDGCEARPESAMLLNSQAAGTLAASSARIGASFVYVSTDSVFDGCTGGYGEDDRPNPLNHYSRSKVAGEVSVTSAHPNALVVRTNMYGWNAQPKLSLAEWVLSRLRAGSVVPGFQDVWFNPLHAADLAVVILDLLARRARGIVHAGARDSCSKYGFACTIADVFGLDTSLIKPAILAQASFRAQRPHNTVLKVECVSSLLGRKMATVRGGLIAMKEMDRDGGRTRLHELLEGA